MAALTMHLGDVIVTSGEQAIPDIQLGAATDYWALELWADPASTLTGGKAYLGVDVAGVSVAIAVPDATARAQSYTWAYTWSALTYSTPTTSAAGLTLPTLTPGTKTLVVLRRVTAGGSVATPERNSLRVSGTWT